ncbi:MAG: lipopolysaccharide biosynthesis protein, partial [Bacteroidia bacterium]|nr:lipopolysaccharide biosynthesis protein [Bacteroidia bacterium]
SVQGTQFIIMLVMANLLAPSDYGLVGMLTVFLAISYVLVDSGFTSALVRKQNRTQLDNSTVFYFNIVVSLVLYGLLWASSPLVAEFYESPILCELMRVIGITIIINSLIVVPRAILTSKLDFKTQTKASLLSITCSGVLGIWMAYSGYGVWALVWQQVANAIISCVVLFVIVKWRPTFEYSWRSFRDLFGFGSKLLASSMLDTIWRNIYPVVVGKIFSADILGQYSRAQHFSEFPSSNITTILQRVTYPVLCRIQDDDDRLRIIYRRFIRVSAFIVFPLMMCLSACAKPLIKVILNESWAFCATLLMIICFSMMWYPIHAINLNLLQVKGRSDLFLRLEIIKKLFAVIVLCVSVPLGIEIMCYTSIFTSILTLIINTYYTGRLIDCGFFIQIKDIAHILITALFMWGLLILINLFIGNDILRLIVDVTVGLFFYIGASLLFKFKEINELMDLVKI